MDKTVIRLQADFPEHSFDVQKGMFGNQLIVDGVIATSTWDMGSELINNKTFSEEVKGMTTDDMLYHFLKLKVEDYLKQKGALNG